LRQVTALLVISSQARTVMKANDKVNKRDAEQRRFGIGEHAEGDAGIDAVNYVHEVVNDFVPPADWRIWCFDTHFLCSGRGVTTTKVKTSQRRRVGKVTRISLTSEIEERSLHYEPANYAGSPVGMTSPFVGCKNPRSAKRKSSRRIDLARMGRNILRPY